MKRSVHQNCYLHKVHLLTLKVFMVRLEASFAFDGNGSISHLQLLSDALKLVFLRDLEIVHLPDQVVRATYPISNAVYVYGEIRFPTLA